MSDTDGVVETSDDGSDGDADSGSDSGGNASESGSESEDTAGQDLPVDPPPPFSCAPAWEIRVAPHDDPSAAWNGFGKGYDFARATDGATWMLGRHERETGGVYLARLGDEGLLSEPLDLPGLPAEAEGRELEVAADGTMWVGGGLTLGTGAWLARVEPSGEQTVLDPVLDDAFILAGLALDDADEPVVVGSVADAVAVHALAPDGTTKITATVPGRNAGGVAVDDGAALVPSITVAREGGPAQGRLTRIALTDGSEIWSTEIEIDAPLPADGYVTPTGVDVLSDGSAVVAFTSLFGHPAWRFWLARVDADGQVSWVRSSEDLSGQPSPTLLSNAVGVTSADEILVGGTRHTGNVLTAWMLALDADGDELCTYQPGGTDQASVARRVFFDDRAYFAAHAWDEATQWSLVAAVQ